MSYRSIKRVLGESSLERKCRFLFGACLLLLITGSFYWYGSETEKLVYRQNHIWGRLLVDLVLVTRHWGELETGRQPHLLVRDLTENLTKEEYSGEFIWPKRTDITGRLLEEAEADFSQLGPEERAFKQQEREFEQKVVDGFRKSDPRRAVEAEATEFEEWLLPERNEYRYYQPIRLEESCLFVCHGKPPGGSGIDPYGTGLALGGGGVSSNIPLSEGDLMAIVKITIPNEPTKNALDRNRAFLLTAAIVTVFLAMVASYVIVRYVIVKPLRHLREVSEAISRGNTALRAEIHTGDEFESLGVAFNRMLRHLVAAQEELRQVNTNLDAKVDELAQVNMRLYEMNMIKSDFLATMSHELRTPLNSILGFSEVLGSIDSLQEKQKRYVQNIQTSGRMLLEMINDILDLAKMESGKMDTRLTDFPIQQVIGAQCDMARPLAERKNINLETRLQADLPPMHQDQARVQQILNNLLSNAIKFTPEGGRITVGAQRDEENFLAMQVSDTGVGIAEEDQQSIFEKFRQARTAMPGGDAMTREYSGTGLGLSIVRELCRLLGGEVSVESELGKGSTFTVRLPWELKEQPRLDSALVERFEDFTRPRRDLPPEPDPSPRGPVAADSTQPTAQTDR